MGRFSKMCWVMLLVLLFAVTGCGSGEEVEMDSHQQTEEQEQVAQSSDKTKESEEDVTQTLKEKKPEPPKPKTYKEWLKKVVEEEIGAESNLGVPRIAGIDFENKDEFKPILTLIADDNLTLNLVRGGMLMEATDLFKAIFADNRAKNVTICWGRPVTDEYGNTSMQVVMAIQMSRKTADKINWQQFTYKNLPKVSDGYYEKPQSEW